MISRILARFRSIAHAVLRFVLGTQIARLATMAAALWSRVRLLSVLLALLAIACAVLAGLSARTVFTALSPASPSGIGAGIAAGLAALVVVEVCAFTTIAGIEAVLQLAHDLGRHRVGALLALAAILAATVALIDLPAPVDLAMQDWAALGISALLLAMTAWFQRTYRRAARGSFRDFHVDVVDARHFLARGSHGA